MEKADGLNGTSRSPDTQVNGVILSPDRAELLKAAINSRGVESQDGMRKFLAGLEREQRAEDKADPDIAEVRRLMWRNSDPKRRTAVAETRTPKSKAERLAKLADMADQIIQLAAELRK